MKKFLSFLLSFICILLIFNTSCNQKSATTVEYPVVINIRAALRNTVEIKLSDFVDSISYVSIQGFINDEPISLRRFWFSDSYILSESRSNGDLLCFNRNGSFIRRIANKGRGPGEYLNVSDVVVDEGNSVLYVFSSMAKKIYKYSLDGSFLKAFEFGENIDAIAIDAFGQLVVRCSIGSGNAKNNFLLLDNKGDTINFQPNNIFFERESLPGGITIFMNGSVYNYNNQVHIKNKNDTLFVMENDKFIPKYVFLTGDKQVNMTYKEFMELIPFPYIRETSTKLFFQFVLEDQWYNAFYDKINGKVFSTSGQIINDLEDEDNITFSFEDIQVNNEIIKPKYGGFDLEKLKKTVSSSQYAKITNMLDQIEDDDPIIVRILHLK